MENKELQRFWDWFNSKAELLMDIDNIDAFEADDLLVDFDKRLKEYSEGISFELSDLSEKGREIVFSAEGDEDYFDDVIELCENAPDLDFWEFIPFKQAKGGNVKIKFENYSYHSKKLWFLPLENEEFADSIGIMVGVNDFKEGDEDQEIAVYTLIESMVGEYYCTTLIQYFEVCQLPENPEEEGFVNLESLPDFVEWFINNSEKEDQDKIE